MSKSKKKDMEIVVMKAIGIVESEGYYNDQTGDCTTHGCGECDAMSLAMMRTCGRLGTIGQVVR